MKCLSKISITIDNPKLRDCHFNVVLYILGGCSGCGVIPVAPIIDRIPPVLFNIGLSPKTASKGERSRPPLKKRFSNTKKAPVDGVVCCPSPFTVSTSSGLDQSLLPLRKRVNVKKQLISSTPSYKGINVFVAIIASYRNESMFK